MSKKQNNQICEFIGFYKNKTIPYDELQDIEINLICNYPGYEFFIEKVQIVDSEELVFPVYDEIRDAELNQVGPEEGQWQITSVAWIDHNAKLFGKRFGEIRLNNPKKFEWQAKLKMDKELIFYEKSKMILEVAADLFKEDRNKAVEYIVDNFKKINEELDKDC